MTSEFVYGAMSDKARAELMKPTSGTFCITAVALVALG